MTEDRSSDLLGQLPRTRPHRRSAKRPARPGNGSTNEGAAEKKPNRATAKRAAPKAPPKRSTRTAPGQQGKRLPQPAQPRGVPSPSRRRPAEPAQTAGEQTSTPVLGTAVQAATELAEIGLTLTTRAVRRAISRLPRP